jgi:L-aspartate oxidase
LLECLVFAAQLSKLEGLSTPLVNPSLISLTQEKGDWEEEMALISQIRDDLPSLMWHSAGICRTQAVLESALEQVVLWRSRLAGLNCSHYVFDLSPGQQVIFESSTAQMTLRFCAETLNLLDIAYLILKSALFRTESRGGHYRGDYPETCPKWEVHTLIVDHHWWTNPVN